MELAPNASQLSNKSNGLGASSSGTNRKSKLIDSPGTKPPVNHETPGWAHPSQAPRIPSFSTLLPPKERDLLASPSKSSSFSLVRSPSTNRADNPSESAHAKPAKQNMRGLPNSEKQIKTAEPEPSRGNKVSILEPTKDVSKDQKRNPLADRKLRNARKHNRKLDRGFERSDSSNGQRSSSEFPVAHPDILDESYLDTVDSEFRETENTKDLYVKGRTRSSKNIFGQDWERSHRLPDDVIPFQYNLYLEPHIEENLFFGRISMAVNLVLPKAQIWFHARNLHITSTQLFDRVGNQIPILGAHKYRKHEFFVIFLEGNLRAGIYIINIDYNGILSPTNNIGIFLRSYKHRDSFQRSVVYARLEPFYARRVFPCFDEPCFKASYEISVAKPTNDFVVISNMPQQSEEEEIPHRGYTTVIFAPTPRMSSFHISIIICKFHQNLVEDPRLDFPINVFVRDDKVENFNEATKLVIEAVCWFQNYFGMPYPHPKLDLIVMPDMSSLSIDGLSVIIIQENLLNKQDEFEYETLHYTLTHSVISQWIGCSVTITWWSDAWYKEGLTMMLTNLFLDRMYPEQQAIPNFLCYLLQPCMFYDTFVNSNTIYKGNEELSEVSDYIDPVVVTKKQIKDFALNLLVSDQFMTTRLLVRNLEIAYSVQAACIFRMLEQMEPPSFMSSMKVFLSTHQLHNASWKTLSIVLHSTFEQASAYLLSVENMMMSWTQLPGYPLVVTARGQRAVAMTQRKFLSSIDSRNHNLDKYPSWEFPVSYLTSNQPTDINLLYMKSDTIDTEVRDGIPEDVVWYKVNVRQAGFFRVVYQEEEWNNIKKILLNRPQLLTVEDRANILDDMFSLSRAGFLCYGRTLMTLTYLRYGKERSWLPWACVLKHLIFIRNALSTNENDLKNFQNYMNYILEPILKEDVWTFSEADGALRRKWKLSVLNIACMMELPSAKKRLSKLLKEWGFKNKMPKPDELRFLILRYGAPPLGYSPPRWAHLWKMCQEEKNLVEKYKLLAVLATVGNDEQSIQLLKDVQEGSDHSFFTVLYEMATTRSGSQFVWNFIKTNWDILMDRYSTTDSRLSLLFPHVAQMFEKESNVEELSAFSSYSIPTIATALSYANNNIYWNARYLRTITSWLDCVQKILAQSSAGNVPTSPKVTMA